MRREVGSIFFCSVISLVGEWLESGLVIIGGMRSCLESKSVLGLDTSMFLETSSLVHVLKLRRYVESSSGVCTCRVGQ